MSEKWVPTDEDHKRFAEVKVELEEDPLDVGWRLVEAEQHVKRLQREHSVQCPNCRQMVLVTLEVE